MKIFIGSSSEAKVYAYYLQGILEEFGVEVRVWFDSEIFVGSRYTLENLEEAAKWSEGALFIWAADDETIYRNEKHLTARDNVIFETGMFMGRLGKECIGICVDNYVKLPSDLLGFTTIDIDNEKRQLEMDIKNWLSNISRKATISMYARKELDECKTLYERWGYAKEITIVSYAASSFLIPTIASNSIYSRDNQHLFEAKLKAGVRFRFIIVCPDSNAAIDAADNKMKIMAESDISPNDSYFPHPKV